uniref:(northern house mosquito) hypothetical protein n=1 Tax=Culex pipiens TaxID=7175 RepID=A0A8D8BWV6_CULPI
MATITAAERPHHSGTHGTTAGSIQRGARAGGSKGRTPAGQPNRPVRSLTRTENGTSRSHPGSGPLLRPLPTAVHFRSGGRILRQLDLSGCGQWTGQVGPTFGRGH